MKKTMVLRTLQEYQAEARKLGVETGLNEVLIRLQGNEDNQA